MAGKLVDYLELPNLFLENFLCDTVQFCVCFRRQQDAQRTTEPKLCCFAPQCIKILIESVDFDFKNLTAHRFHKELLSMVYEDLQLDMDPSYKSRQQKRLCASLTKSFDAIAKQSFITEVVAHARVNSKVSINQLVMNHMKVWPEKEPIFSAGGDLLPIGYSPYSKTKRATRSVSRFMAEDFKLKTRNMSAKHKRRSKAVVSSHTESSELNLTFDDPHQNLQQPRRFFVYDHASDSIIQVQDFDDLTRNFVSYNDFLHYSNEYDYTFMTKTFFQAQPSPKVIRPCRCDMDVSNPCVTKMCARRANNIECPKIGGHVCDNQRVQDFSILFPKVEIYQTGSIGRGIRAIVPIADGELVAEFYGCFVTKDDFKRFHDTEDGKYSIQYEEDWYLDLEDSGLHARLANFSCQPNSCLVQLFVDGMPRYVLEAQQEIEIGEPITVSYGDQYNLKNCQCGSKYCKSKQQQSAYESDSSTS